MVYNPQVKKDAMEVVIRTANEKIEGIIYKLPDMRLLDMLNKTADDFLAVSEAKVYDLETGRLEFESEFLAVNRMQILFMAESYTIPNN